MKIADAMKVAPFVVSINGKRHLFLPDGHIVPESWSALFEASEQREDIGKQGTLWG